MTDLQDFIEDITTNKLRFCAVCFRTEKDRKLVSPSAISQFIEYTAVDQLSDTEYACIYCERQAEVALKLYNTLCYARHVSRVLLSLVRKDMTPKSIAYLLPSKIRGQASGPSSVKRNKLLSSLRQFQSYTQTDVLVVDTVRNNIADNNNSEVLVIEDDDEEEKRAKNIPRLVPIEKLLKPQSTIDPPKTVATDNIVIFPFTPAQKTDNQFLNVPNNTNIELRTLNVANLSALFPNGTILYTPQIGNQIFIPAQDNNNVNKDYVTLDRTVEDVILPDKGKIGEKIVKNVVISNKADEIPNQMNIVDNASEMADVMGPNGDVTGRKCDEICRINNVRSLQDDNVFADKPPEPRQTDPNIDWEDKIPMDVIKFMAVSNPVASKLISKDFTPRITTPKIVTPTHNFTPTNPHAPNTSVTTTVTPAHTVTSVIARVNSTNPVVPKHNTVLSSIPVIHTRVTPVTPNVVNHTSDFVQPTERGRPRRKRKSEDDDDVIIVL